MVKSMRKIGFIFIPFLMLHARLSGLQTNGLDVHEFPPLPMSVNESNAVFSALSNEFRLLNEYQVIMEQDGRSDIFQKIIISKKYHVKLIEDLYKKYRLETHKSENTVRNITNREIPVRDACKIKVKEELENKMFYEKQMVRLKNKDIRAVFLLISKNSERTFKLLQDYILNKKQGG